MVSLSRWLLRKHETRWVGMTLEIYLETDAPCHLTMRYQQAGIKIHERITMKRGLPFSIDPHLAFDNYQTQEQEEAGDTLVHRFSIDFPHICKTYYWKFTGTVDGLYSPSHSPVFSQHLTEVEEVTKEIYFDVMTGLPYGNMASIGHIPVMRCLASAHYARIAFMVPHNFNALELAELIVIPRCSLIGAEWGLSCQFASAGELYHTHTNADFDAKHNTVDLRDQILKVDVAYLFDGIEVGDFGGFELWQRHADHDVYVMGLRWKYV